MGFLDLFRADEDTIVVKRGTSKGPNKPKVDIGTCKKRKAIWQAQVKINEEFQLNIWKTFMI